jgi:hypothetical protein
VDTLKAILGDNDGAKAIATDGTIVEQRFHLQLKAPYYLYSKDEGWQMVFHLSTLHTKIDANPDELIWTAA